MNFHRLRVIIRGGCSAEWREEEVCGPTRNVGEQKLKKKKMEILFGDAVRCVVNRDENAVAYNVWQIVNVFFLYNFIYSTKKLTYFKKSFV